MIFATAYRSFSSTLCTIGTIMYLVAMPATRSLAKTWLRSLGVSGSSEGAEIVSRVWRENGGGIFVFPHPTIMDPIVVIAETPPDVSLPRFVAKAAWYMQVFATVAKNLQTIFIEKGVKTTDVIKQEAKACFVGIAPAGGFAPNQQHDLGKFRTGAFVHGGDVTVIPVIIHYTPYEPWKLGENLLKAIWRRWSGPCVRYRVKFMEPIPDPYNGENPEAYAELYRAAMQKELQAMGT